MATIGALQTDVTVELSAQQTVITEGLGTPAIFMKSDKNKLTEFYDAQAVGAAYGTDKNVTQLAQLIFGQANRPEHLDVIEYSDLSSALIEFGDDNWVFGLLDDVSVTDTVNEFISLGASMSKKMFVVQVDDVSKTGALGNLDNAIVYVHPFDKGRLDAAVVGAVANLQPGSVTWKFRQVSGIKPSGFSSDMLHKIAKANANAYAPYPGGVYATTDGITLGHKYIDDLHARLWVENEIVSELQKLLLNNPKVTYDSVGIAAIGSAIQLTLERAYQNKIIATDEKTAQGAYRVTTTPRSKQSSSDIASRRYVGASFEYEQAGAIHSITVSGQIVDALK